MRRSSSRIRTLALLSSTCFAVASPLSALAATAPGTSIRSVDFHNHTYDIGEGVPSDLVTVRDGVHESGTRASETYVSLAVTDVDYGDLDGDGREEAVVSLALNTGGTGVFTWGRVFAMRSGTVRTIGDLSTGDRASGGLHDVTISNGVIFDDRYGGDAGACCPEYVERFRVRLAGTGKLRYDGPISRRPVVQLEASTPPLVRFFAGGNSAALIGYAEPGASMAVRFRARARQRVGVCLLDPDTMVTVTTAPGITALRRSSVGCTTVPWTTTGEATLTVTGTGPTARTARAELIIR